MKYVIFSDVHSNLESLHAFIDVVADVPHDKKICLGDLVGYAADPNACVDWVRENANLTIAGNHDFAAVEKTDVSYFNSYAYQSCMWTRKVLSAENREFLSALPLFKEEAGVHWVHAAPLRPEDWDYITNAWEGERQMEHFSAPVCFYGHTHRPCIFEQEPGGATKMYVESSWDLKPNHKYIVNVGSLGQPRDGNPDPAFVVYDNEARRVEWRRFSYDFQATQEKILQAGLPAVLADRLGAGR